MISILGNGTFRFTTLKALGLSHKSGDQWFAWGPEALLSDGSGNFKGLQW